MKKMNAVTMKRLPITRWLTGMNQPMKPVGCAQVRARIAVSCGESMTSCVEPNRSRAMGRGQ
jgi:hypothetical protein